MSPTARSCRRCRLGIDVLDSIVPLAMCPAGSDHHRALRHYKDSPCLDVRDALTQALNEHLRCFLLAHASCLTTAAERFDVITVVPGQHPSRLRLAWIASEQARVVGAPFQPLLAPRARLARGRVDSKRFVAATKLHGRAVLLIDDMWVTGGSARSAAATLRRAGATRVAAVVFGRFVNPSHADNARRLAGLPTVDRSRCVRCSAAEAGADLAAGVEAAAPAAGGPHGPPA